MKKSLIVLAILVLTPFIQINATQSSATTQTPQQAPQQAPQAAHKKKGDPRIFSGSAHPQLGSKISEIFSQTPGDIKIKRFNDGEISIQYNED